MREEVKDNIVELKYAETKSKLTDISDQIDFDEVVRVTGGQI